MGIELLEIGDKMRKLAIFTIRGCFRSVCNHPFLVGFLCFLILLYRSSPFIFSLLLSASPILICTAVLLGVLLSYGEPNIPEIEIEEKTTFEAVSMKTGVLGDSAVVEQNGSYFVERFSEKREDRSDDTSPLIKERSWEIESNDGEILEENRELGDSSPKLKTEWIDEKLNDEVVESDDEKSEADSFDSEKVNVDSLDSPPRSPWKRIEEREDEEEEEEEEERADEEEGASDSGSDWAESSSPDASMADIMPMLDELHPLLDDETPQPVRTSRSGSDVASEKSSKSSTTKSHESDDETENHDDLEDQDDDDNEDGEDEEDAQGEKEEPIKSAIIWTEEDQKNLMDLGTSEIERNQRLENLILRRRARKNITMVPERNLIDLESTDYPFGLAPISTRRQNPFDDLPHNSYDNSGLPPIPGSAPSVLLPRRNPFDIPYDSSEEKPDLVGDGFKEEFTTFQSRDVIFRRHESFNVGPSLFAPNRKDVRMRPYFVPEGTVLEESSYSSSFQRQSSELSESKVSSVPETESIGSVEDLEDKKLSDEDNQQEIEGPLEDPQLISHQEEDEEEDVNRQPELISEIENVPELVGHGSQSSEDEESSALDRAEKREVDQAEKIEVEVRLEDVADHSHQESVSGPVEVQATEYHPNYEDGEPVYRSDSSSSSLSEVSERFFTEIESEGLSMLEERRDNVSGVGTNLSISDTLVIDVPQRAPVYDSSPRQIENSVSSSSISYVGRESEGNGQEIETAIRSNVEILPETSFTHPVDEPRSTDVIDVIEHENVNIDFLEVEKESEIETSNVSISLKKSSVEALVKENVVEEHGLGEVSGARADESIHNLDKSSEDQFEVSETLFDGQLRGEDTIGMEERETVQSLDSDDDAYQRADEKLISTPSAEGNTYPLHDAREIHEPNFQHLDEVQASSVLVELSEDVQITQNLNMPEIQELDHDIPSNINSPLSPELISNPPRVTETTDSHFNVQTTIDEVDDIKEIDEDLLSELDNVGDFSVQQWGSGSSVFEKRIDSVEESFAHHVETNTTRVDSVEENKLEDVLHSEKSSEVIDIHAEGVEYISELQTSETSENETLSKENEVQPVRSVVSRDYEDNISEIPESEVQSKEDVDFVSEKDESTLPETEITYRGQVDTETTSRIAELEVSKIKDSDLAFKEITAKETIVDFEPVVKETIAEHSENRALDENSSVAGSTHETSVLEIRPIEKDASLDSKQSLSDSVDRALHVIESEETQETFSEVDVAEKNVPSEKTTLPSNDKVLDGKSLEPLKPNSDDGSVEVKEDEVGSSAVESRVQEIDVAAEKPDHEVEAPKDSHSAASVKGKGKISKSSSSSLSSSSSSSDSSSSDSDKE